MIDEEARLTVALPAGTTDTTALWSVPEEPWAWLALAHGAGGGPRHPFLEGFAHSLCAAGVGVLRFAFAYQEAGRRMPGPAPHAIEAWVAADTAVRARAGALPVLAAGKSYGGRMASMAAAQGRIAPAGLVYLGYPLHPPGDPDKARTAHLPDIRQPQLFVEGSNDPFIQPLEQFAAAVASCRTAAVSWIPGGGHSFEVKGARRPAEQIGAGLAPRVVEWMRELVAP